ncbi:hypothetical protein I0C86_41540 [Plantactinospora sp. S1510]|uniref:Uncharacterized protein n=1 Tax=Plantactinospora alkalitolerans TaxID=2789879 RepID=A0ABS0HA28_9ACTN|nr:hypothetical protein [Plantactinospora alkalitolerans]MBF9135337.1 hypothetical protein [Plantactinospora alkalitolerans]
MATVAHRAWSALGTPTTVRIITAGMLVYAIMIGALVFGYARVSSCLASYADASAKSTAARADAAAEDRALAELDRQAAVRNEDALDETLQAMARGGSQAEVQKSFDRLLLVRAETARIRTEANTTRADIEERRRLNPVPPPPSESC